jgi:hypothetical protein
MQSIVADTTPLNYLVLIQAADILPKLYRKVLFPPAVRAALDLAAAHGLVDLQTMFDRLRATTFRSPLRLVGSKLEQDVEQRKRQRDRQ